MAMMQRSLPNAATSASRRSPCALHTPVAKPNPRRDVSTHAGFNPGDMIRGMFDFDSWAPKSSRIWRLGHYEHPEAADATAEDASLADLEQQVRRRAAAEAAAASNGGTLQGQPSSSASSSASPSSNSASSSPPSQPGSFSTASTSGTSGGYTPSDSFSSVEDVQLASALQRRVQEIASSSSSSSSSSSAEDSVDREANGEIRKAVVPLEGPELRSLIYGKYSKTLDVSIVRRDIPGKSFVSLNILWNHLEQRSFKMTEAQYMEKLESVAMMVNLLNQTDKVRNFLLSPARSQNGMPARPVVGTAISIRFENLSKEVVEEWFGAGYF